MISSIKVSSAPVQSLYVHVPFCATKCEYCAFYSEASSGEQMNRYVEALLREMERALGSGVYNENILDNCGEVSLR